MYLYITPFLKNINLSGIFSLGHEYSSVVKHVLSIQGLWFNLQHTHTPKELNNSEKKQLPSEQTNKLHMHIYVCVYVYIHTYFIYFLFVLIFIVSI